MTGAACPVCQKPRAPRYAPFCSRRCADVDLGRWLTGGYAIPGPPDPEAAEQAISQMEKEWEDKAG